MESEMSMIERVGLAALEGLLDRRGIKWELEAVRSESPDIWDEIVQETGEAAIRAMHDPSEEMMPSEVDTYVYGLVKIPADQLKLIYQSLIDAALAPHSGKGGIGVE